MSGIAESIAKTIIRMIGAKRAILAIVLLGAILTYSGVSLFVVVFAVYPFAANLFREANIPKRLIPGTIALGAFTFTMDALPGTPQIQNVIPTTFFKTDIYAAPIMGTVGGLFILVVGMWYLESRKKKAHQAGEGYAGFEATAASAAPQMELKNEPEMTLETDRQPVYRQVLAFVPLVLVAVMNKVFTLSIPKWYPEGFDFSAIGLEAFGKIETPAVLAIWSVQMALLIGILAAMLYDFPKIKTNFQAGLNVSIGGALLAVMNTGAEYGFGGVIAAFLDSSPSQADLRDIYESARQRSRHDDNTSWCHRFRIGWNGIALSAMSDKYTQAITSGGVPPEVMHRVISMASGGMDTLPHNGAVITLLAVTGLTHRQSYKDIFMITILKTVTVFLMIGLYSLTGLY